MTDGNAAWIGVIGTLAGAVVGGLVGYVATTRHDRRCRVQEIADLKAGVYAEVADRAARCVNDYIVPWKDQKVDGPEKLSAERIGKFRPMGPVVFPGIAGKVGAFDAEALIAVTQFYFRLDALSQAIDSLRAVYEQRETAGDLPMVKQGDDKRIELIRTRLKSCFEPAARSLEKLAVPDARAFDEAAARVYPHLKKSGFTLREALEAHSQKLNC